MSKLFRAPPFSGGCRFKTAAIFALCCLCFASSRRSNCFYPRRWHWSATKPPLLLFARSGRVRFKSSDPRTDPLNRVFHTFRIVRATGDGDGACMLEALRSSLSDRNSLFEESLFAPKRWENFLVPSPEGVVGPTKAHERRTKTTKTKTSRTILVLAIVYCLVEENTEKMKVKGRAGGWALGGGLERLPVIMHV